MKKYKKISITTIIMLLICGIFFSMTASAVDKSDTNESGNNSSIETQINDLIENNKDTTPSVAVKVFNDEHDICSVIYGKSDIENNISADENTVYEWGSVSKVLIWTSVMQLYEKGKLDLNGDIKSYLPDGFLTKLSYDKPITMLDLMNHSAGFLNPYKEMETENLSELMTLENVLRDIEPGQAYPPGETTAYSNYGAALAGYIVERVSGMNYADYVKQNIFDRLKMEHTAIRPDLSDNEWVKEQRKKTHCYYTPENKMESLGECRRYIHIYPAGSACGTIGDMALFAKAFLSDSKSCPLFDNENTLSEMLSPSMYFADSKTPRFYHGLMGEKVGMLTMGHGGNTEGFTSLIQFDTKAKTGFVMMTNKQQDRVYQSELMKIIYGSADLSGYSTDSFKKIDFSGQYNITGGTLENGCFRLYSFFNDKFEVSEQNGRFTGNLGVTEVKQISDNAVLFRLVTGAENLAFIRTDNSGEFAGFENDTFDFIKISDSEYYLGWVTLILMVTGLVFLLLMMIVHIVKLRKFKGLDSYSFKRTELFMNISAAAVFVGIALMFSLDMLDDTVRMILCIMVSVFCLLLLVMNIPVWIKKPKGSFNAVVLIETLCSIFVAAGVVYWRLFQFWGC